MNGATERQPRQELVVVFGARAVFEALRARRRRVHEVWIAEGRHTEGRPSVQGIDALCREAESAGTPVHWVARHEIERRAGSDSHQGVVAMAEPLPRVGLDLVGRDGNDELAVALDCVQDPHNLGAILRTAVAGGAAAVITPRDRSASLTPAATKVAEGAAEHVPVIGVTNLHRALLSLREKGFWSVGFAMDGGSTLWDADLLGRRILVFGGEGTGLRRLVRETCDHVVRIPMVGPVESMNVSAVVAVGLFEALRQRQRHAGRDKPT